MASVAGVGLLCMSAADRRNPSDLRGLRTSRASPCGASSGGCNDRCLWRLHGARRSRKPRIGLILSRMEAGVLAYRALSGAVGQCSARVLSATRAVSAAACGFARIHGPLWACIALHRRSSPPLRRSSWSPAMAVERARRRQRRRAPPQTPTPRPAHRRRRPIRRPAMDRRGRRPPVTTGSWV